MRHFLLVLEGGEEVSGNIFLCVFVWGLEIGEMRFSICE